MITIAQIRAARAMLGLKQQELAQKAGLSTGTLNNIERGVQTDPKLSTLKAIQKALEAEGVEFTEGAMGVVGVNLKPRRDLQRATILLVDDNKADRVLYKNWLAKDATHHYHIVEAQDATSGLDAYIQHRPDCIVLDFMMYGANGFQLLAALRNKNISLPPIIFVTAMHSDTLEERAKSQGVQSYFNKQNLSKEVLCKAVEHALRGN